MPGLCGFGGIPSWRYVARAGFHKTKTEVVVNGRTIHDVAKPMLSRARPSDRCCVA